jgi:hypothetical protein
VERAARAGHERADWRSATSTRKIRSVNAFSFRDHPGQDGTRADVSWEVVGVIGDEKIGGPADDRSAGVYVSNEQSPVYGMVLNVRTDVDPLTCKFPSRTRSQRQQGPGHHRQYGRSIRSRAQPWVAGAFPRYCLASSALSR